MHSSSVLAALTAVVLPFVQAQSVSLSDLPKCAQSAATAGLKATTCDLTDLACICGQAPFITAMTKSVQASCSAADQQVTLKYAQALCSQYGVQISGGTADTVSTPSAAPEASSPSTSEATAPAETPTAATDSLYAPTMPAAPVSSDALSSSSQTPYAAAAPTSGPSMASDVNAPPATSTSSSLLVSIDTQSVVPSATIAEPTDAPQMASSTAAYKSNSTTANTTVAASSPIPYTGGAVRGKVQGAGMALMGLMAVFCGL
ncbi:MAG: hypothetical protein L6R39_004569 [Caloplaca ligustica]|nr:MAG: hypothetical protein L6R39_004569 [Caloplaca ligustica]